MNREVRVYPQDFIHAQKFLLDEIRIVLACAKSKAEFIGATGTCYASGKTSVYKLPLTLHIAERFKILRVLSAFYWILIGICFLNLGANDPLVVAIAMILTAALLVAGVCLIGVPEPTQSAIFFSLGVALFLFLWVVFQNTPLPAEIFANPAWSATSNVWPHRHPAIVSVTPGDDYIAYLKLALPIALLITGLLLFRSDNDAEKVLGHYSGAVVLIAVLSLAQFFFFPNMLILSEKRFYSDSLTGFFINRNTAATFFGLGTLLVFAQTWRQFDGRWWRHMLSTNGLGARRNFGTRGPQTRFIFLALATLAPLIALISTKSRAGVSFSFLAIFMFISIMSLTKRGTAGSPRTRWKLAIRLMVVFFAVAVVFSVLGAQVITKLEVRGLADPRFCVLPGIIGAAKDHFPWGAGLASFQEIFPAYRDPVCGLTGVWDKAHNLYVEGILTIGIAFPIILSVCLGYLLWAFASGLRNRKRFRFAGALGCSSLMLVVAHSGFDFSLQIPGFAIAYAALLAPVITLCLRPSQSA